jgi:hypothetical protein
MKSIFTFLLVFLLQNGYSQNENDYIKYYNLCNSGDSLRYLKNYKIAFEKYQMAFKTVDFIHAINLRNASIAASKLNEGEIAWYYAKRAILGGEDEKFLKNAFPKFLKKENLKDSIEFFKNLHQQRINHQYIKEIDSLFFIDQNIIRGNKSVKTTADFSSFLIPANKFDLDNEIWSHLLNLTKKFGFPSEKNIGPNAYLKASIILHHNLRKPQNNYQMEMAIKALKDGDYMPSNFAWMYDQSFLILNKTPIFYFGSKDPSKLSKNEMREIDNYRRLLGIKPFAAYKIRAKNGFVAQKSIW